MQIDIDTARQGGCAPSTELILGSAQYHIELGYLRRSQIFATIGLQSSGGRGRIDVIKRFDPEGVIEHPIANVSTLVDPGSDNHSGSRANAGCIPRSQFIDIDVQTRLAIRQDRSIPIARVPRPVPL